MLCVQIEIHCSAEDCPFTFNELLDIDAVFRDKVDQSTYQIILGCGGCVASQDPVIEAPLQLKGYLDYVVEPFTQTRYTSIFPKEERKYNTSGIHPDVCDQNHWTLRLIDFANRTDGSELRWGAVIGLAEDFTPWEYFIFPWMALQNHSDVWNEAGYSFWLILFLLAPLLVSFIRWGQRRAGWSVLESSPVKMVWEEGQRMPTLLWQRENPRALLYDLAVLVLVAWMLEGVWHLIIAVQGTSASDYGVWVALSVIFIPNGLALWQVLVFWEAMEYYRNEPEEGASWFGRQRHGFLVCCRSPLWAPFELFAGVFFLFLFGTGVFAAPIFIILAALLRCCEIPGRNKPRQEPPKFRVEVVPWVPEGEDTKALFPPLGKLAGLT